MQTITPCLWFEDRCEEAVNFYISVFKESSLKDSGNSKINSIRYYPEGAQDGPMKGMEGKVLAASYTLAGQQFLALDGGPYFKFNEAISLMIECESQEQIDYFSEKMSADPEAEQCGWIKDKYGVSWQISPKILNEYMSDPDEEKVARVAQAFLKMKRFDIQKLKEAYEGR